MGQIRLRAERVAEGDSRQIKGTKIGEQIGTNLVVQGKGCEEVKRITQDGKKQKHFSSWAKNQEGKGLM